MIPRMTHSQAANSRGALQRAFAWAWWMVMGCVLLFGTGNSALVHAHDDHGAHVHLLGRSGQQDLAQAHAVAHQQEHCGHQRHEPGDGPQVSDPESGDRAVLVSLPEGLALRERCLQATLSLPPPLLHPRWSVPALAVVPSPTPRERPFVPAHKRSGHARLLLSSHAILT